MMHIARHNDYHTSNFALRGAIVPLKGRILVGARPDGDGWERVWQNIEEYQKVRTPVRLHEGRKQIAARRAAPVEIRKIPLALAPPEVVDAILEGQGTKDIKILKLEARVRELMGLLGGQ